MYARRNILATQALLEVSRNAGLARLVYASSSSVYGDVEHIPTGEDELPRPVSPYGVTKLAAEHLCLLYAKQYHVPVVALRYFSVYGPRQRPDMAFRLFVQELLNDRPIQILGDGEQTRDFTFVADVVEGPALSGGGLPRAASAAPPERRGETAGRGGTIRYEDPSARAPGPTPAVFS